ncbi:MAG: murein DD-endopeptidase MepM/ murein hydrolase activator NlpD [Verrucomicrobiales bacterium]|jgi:murein DD-endopeptidase MepM/ murein hydrolase activator NlpD
MHLRILFLLVSLAPSLTIAQSKPLQLTLPTDNDAIFSNDPSKFYMYTNRNFEGVSSKPWTGGKYGYVRNQKRSAEGVIMTRFHEGVDIRPVRRDKAGKPLDDVRSIAKGKVVHTNTVSSRSSYGNYVVVEHDWGHGPFYSLYAHLMSVSVKPGQQVSNSSTLGRLGYTGNGLNVERSHLHMELNLLLSSRFEKWHDKHHTSPNHHGLYNGINMVGIDIAGLLIRHRENPNITIPEFIAGMNVYYKVLVPNKGKMELLERYPWIGKNLHLARGNPSWEIHFSKSGVPIAVVPFAEKVNQARVSWVQYSKTFHSYYTRSRVGGSGSKGSLTDSGKKYVELLTGQF